MKVEGSGAEAETDTSLPDGWRVSPLEQVADCALGKMLDRAKHRQGHELPYLRNVNVRWGSIDTDDLLTMCFRDGELDRYGLRKGDLLICEGGEPGRAAVWRGGRADLKFQKALHRVRPRKDLDARWLMYQLQLDAMSGHLDRHFTGSTIKHLTGKSLARYSVKVAPLPEQRRILARIEELLSQVNSTRQRLARVLGTLKRLRQSILAAACSGRLTWGVRAGSLDDALPPRWRWATIEELVPRGGLFDGPFGSSLRTSDYTTSGVRVIRLENVGHLRFVGSKTRYVSQQKYKTLERHTVRGGDILFASFIEDEVRACVLPPLEGAAIAKADCFCLRPKAELVDRHYLAMQLVSDSSRGQLLESVHGATRPRVNTRQLRALKVRLCPLPEQGEIVRYVQAFFTLADTVEQRVAAAEARADRLTQAILAKAFRGELVPTAGDDPGATGSNGE